MDGLAVGGCGGVEGFVDVWGRRGLAAMVQPVVG